MRSGSYQFNLEAANDLPPNILFGTSSWTYPGWQGTVYHEQYQNDKAFRADSLGEYCRFPWFRTVGIDSSFYGPPAISTLQRYRDSVSENFCWVSKVWEEITVPVYGRHKRYGVKAGKENPNYLNADLFASEFLSRYTDADVVSHTGPFVFQFQAMPQREARQPAEFVEQLDSFLGSLPGNFRYAVEVRNKELLVPEYFASLGKHEVTHCFNHWTGMPPLVEQMKFAANGGGIAAPFLTARILTPIGTNYQQAVKRFSPYDSLRAVQQEMRKDVVRLAKRAFQRKIPVYVLVNNRCEGYAPGTIDAVGTKIVEECKSWSTD